VVTGNLKKMLLFCFIFLCVQLCLVLSCDYTVNLSVKLKIQYLKKLK